MTRPASRLDRLRLLRTPPWRRAPFRLWHSPSLFFAVLVTAAVLGVAAVSLPLFLSSAGNAAVRDDLVRGCPADVGLKVSRLAAVEGVDQSTIPSRRDAIPLQESTDALDAAVAPIGGVEPGVVTLTGPLATVITDQERQGLGGVRLVSRTGSDDHIEVLSSVATPGIWLTDTTAAEVDAQVGQPVTIRMDGTGAAGAPVVVPVQGIYRDLSRVDREPFWCSNERLFKETFPGDPPPVALLDQDALLDVLRRSGVPTAEVTWEYSPDATGWSLVQARSTLAALREVSAASTNPSDRLGQTVGPGSSSTDLTSTIDHADDAASTAQGAVGPVALGTAGVALLMLLVGARTWIQLRRQEITFLAIRGAGTSALILKGLLELTTPLFLGEVVGVLVGYRLIASVGPSSLIESSTLRSAVALAAVAGLVVLIAFTFVLWPGVRSAHVVEQRTRHRAPRLLWEPIVLVLAAAAYYELSSRGSSVFGGGGRRVDSLVLLFPVLLLAGGSGLFARAVLGGRFLRGIAPRLPTPAWLAARRLQASRSRAVAVVAGAAMSVGLVLFAGSMSASLRATIDAKAILAPGSNQILRLETPADLPTDDPLGPVSTGVTRTAETSSLFRGHPPADVLGVDPSTFASAAYWDSSLADRSLSSLLSGLGPVADGELPAIAVGNGLPDELSMRVTSKDGVIDVPVRVTGRADAFPGFGFQSPRPMIVVDRRALDDLGVTDGAELWVASDAPDVEAEVRAAGLPVRSVLRAADQRQGSLQPQLWALDYIQLVGLLAAAIPICGLGLYFGAIARQRRLGVMFSRKLGLSTHAGAESTGVEVGAMIGLGLGFGAAASWVAIRIVNPYLDTTPTLAPPPLFRFDGPGLLLALLGAIAVTVVATVAVERRATRSSLPDLMRHAD